MLRHYLVTAARAFAHHKLYNPLYFLTAGLVALAIAWATVYANTLRLASANPIHALLYE